MLESTGEGPRPLQGKITVEPARAAKSFGAKGKTIGLGSRASRLQLGETTDARTQVAIKTMEQVQASNPRIKLLDRIKYVSVDIGGHGRVALNIGSLKRLGISKSQAVKAAAQGTLPELIQRKVEETEARLEQYDEILDELDVMYEERDVDGRTMLVSTGEHGVETGISKSELQKAVRVGLTRVKTNGKLLSFGRTRVLVQRNAAGALGITSTHGKERLGRGTFGDAIRVTDITTASQTVMKRARTDWKTNIIIRRYARKDVVKEAKILMSIHEGGRKVGIQKPPAHSAFRIGRKMKKSWYGFVGAVYNKGSMDGMTVGVTPSPATRQVAISGFYQTLCGLATLEEKKIIHGDIKPQNVLCNEEQDKTWTFDISDLGGARHIDSIDFGSVEYRLNPMGVFSDAYVPAGDVAGIKAAAKKGDRDRYLKLQQKRDVFALGASFYEFLTGSNPFDYPNGHADVEGAFVNRGTPAFFLDNVREKGFSEDVVGLFEKMFDPDPDKRCSGTEAKAMMEDIIRSEYPALAAQWGIAEA